MKALKALYVGAYRDRNEVLSTDLVIVDTITDIKGNEAHVAIEIKNEARWEEGGDCHFFLVETIMGVCLGVSKKEWGRKNEYPKTGEEAIEMFEKFHQGIYVGMQRNIIPPVSLHREDGHFKQNPVDRHEGERLNIFCPEFEIIGRVKKLINCTPHPLNLQGVDGNWIELPKSETPARVSEEEIETAGNISGIPLTRKTFGEIVNLPKPDGDSVFIVSLPCLMAMKAAGIVREDVYAPSVLIRDKKGRVIGAAALTQI